jgi:hypothetical protein
MLIKVTAKDVGCPAFRVPKPAKAGYLISAWRKIRAGARHSCRFSVKRRAALKKLECLTRIDVEAA